MPKEKLFLITAPTGNTGAPTVEMLRAAGHRVRAFVHRIDHRSDALAALGAEIVQGDLLDFRSVSSAMTGVDAVVNMSQISERRGAKSNAAQHHWIAERLLDRAAFKTTHLWPTFFAEWLKWQWQRDDDEGVLRLPFGAGRHAPISGADQAVVIAAILQNSAPHDRQVYPLVGAHELDHYRIADEIADTLGFPVRYEPVSMPVFAAGLTAAGFPEFFVQHISSVAQDYQDGIFAGENNLVEVIGGHPPMTVADYVNANRAEFDHDGRFVRRGQLKAS